jgi:microcystin-dependent protein
MSEPFLGEIRAFGFGFPPKGWAVCAGQLLAIAQNTALFSLLGTAYGGDGKTTFKLPDLRGRVPVDAGQGRGLTARSVGDSGGTETVTLNAGQLAPHTHGANCNSTKGEKYTPAGNYWALDGGAAKEYTPAGNAQMAADVLQPAGGRQPHNNLQPYLAVNFCIALNGIFPSRN